MGFLTEISKKADVNKMTTQNLSIVFGPTLIVPEKQEEDIPKALKQIKISQQIVTILLMYGLDEEFTNETHTESESEEEMAERLQALMGSNDKMNKRLSVRPRGR